jgi:hypothetical protein
MDVASLNPAILIRNHEITSDKAHPLNKLSP